MKYVLDRLLEEVKAHNMLSNIFPNILLLWNNVEKYGGAREAAENE